MVGHIYYMPKHNKIWVVSEAGRMITLINEAVLLECPRGNIEWMIEVGMLEYIGEL